MRQALVFAASVLAMLAASAAPGAAVFVSPPSRTLPPVNGRFDYQIGGAYRPDPPVAIVDRDRTASPAPGVYNICYVNGFQTQAYQDHWWTTHHRSLLLRRGGRYVEDPGWPGEILLDTATAAKRRAVAAVIGGWIDGCARKGFNGVELDNLDANTRSHHLLTATDELDLAAMLAARAHADGLAIAQKNDAELGARQRQQVGFDFAIAEQCQVYRECREYQRAYGRHVIEIEYTVKAYNAACRVRGHSISIILRDLNVTPRGNRRYVYRAC